MKFSIPFSYLPLYILILSLFISSFIIQYAALLFFLGCFLFLKKKPAIKNNSIFFISLCFIGIAFVSYVFNYVSGNADGYTIIFWMFSYFPPILLIWILPAYSGEIDFQKIYRFYKILVYVQSFFLLYSVIKYKKIIVGDLATGTVGDANWAAFHICIVLIYEITFFVVQTKQHAFSPKTSLKKIIEIIYFSIIFFIPESTANLGLLLIVLGLIFLREYIFSGFKLIRIAVFVSLSAFALWGISRTYLYKRINESIIQLNQKDISKNAYLAKANIYKKLLSGDIYSNTNWLIGSGPATFTSRSSVMRMPDERVNEFPVTLPYFKSILFKKYISPIYAEWRKTRESYGNFASPQTSVISIAVELGGAGILCFILLFYFILKKIRKTHFAKPEIHVKKFAFYFSIFYILSLFHLNFWEYPIITFTYHIFIFIALQEENKI